MFACIPLTSGNTVIGVIYDTAEMGHEMGGATGKGGVINDDNSIP
jgi:hypothetical protein